MSSKATAAPDTVQARPIKSLGYIWYPPETATLIIDPPPPTKQPSNDSLHSSHDFQERLLGRPLRVASHGPGCGMTMQLTVPS